MKTYVSVSTLLVTLVMMLPATRVHSNGWEHGAIPFAMLVKALEVEAPEMRRRAAESLGLRGQPEAIEPLPAILILEINWYRSAILVPGPGP